MTDRAKRRYMKGQKQTRDHRCHWPTCEQQVPPAMWGCRAHWLRLPKDLRNRVWATYELGQEISMTPSADYMAVARDIQRWIASHDG